MESTPGKRLQAWREFKGLSLTDVFKLTGVKVTTLSTAESATGSNPSYDTITKLLAAFPDLNPDWLLLGTGPMLRDGKVLTPVVTEEVTPARQYGGLTAQAGGQQRDELVQQLRQQIADQANTIERLWKQNDTLLDRKPEASADAADLYAEIDQLSTELFRPLELPDYQRFRPMPVRRLEVGGFGRPAA